jgi:cob(I)alamin adenosyltransferase
MSDIQIFFLGASVAATILGLLRAIIRALERRVLDQEAEEGER